jgi:hypothetical protein
MVKYTVIAPPNEKFNHLTEIMQAVEIKFSFATVNEDNSVQRVHEWVKCRDFLGDVLVGHATKKEQAIYGFSYGTKDSLPIDDNNLTLLLKFPNATTRNNFMENTPILDTLNSNNKAQPTAIDKTDDPLILLLTSDVRWQRNIPVESFYTFILKIMGYKYTNPENWMEELKKWPTYPSERNYVSNTSTENMNMLFADALNVFPSTDITGHTKSTPLVNVHNYSGFYSICGTHVQFKETIHVKDHQKYVARIKEEQLAAEKAAAELAAAAIAGAAAKPRKVAKAINPATKTNLKKRKDALLAAGVFA